MSHRWGQRSPQSVRRSEDCLAFFRVWRGLFLLSLSGLGFGLGGRGGGLVAILGSVFYSTTEHTQVVIEAALSFLLSELAVFSELVGKGGGATGGRGGLPGFVLPGGFVVVLVGVTGTGCGSFTFVVGLVLAIRLVIAFRLVLPGTGLFAVAFPIMGVDGMSKDLHGFKSGGFAVLSHNVLDAFGKPRVIAVAEDTVIPTGADGKAVEFNIILDNVLVVLHFKVVDSIFRIGSRINGAKLDAEGSEEGGPIVHPIRSIIGVKDGWLKVLQSGTAKVRQGKGDLPCIIRVGGVVTEVKIAEEDEVVELFWVGTVKSVGFLSFSSMSRRLIFAMAEFAGHEEDSLR